MMMLDFLIIAAPRSGSHMLATALDSHPDIQCLGELQYYNSSQHHATKTIPVKTGKLLGGLTHVEAYLLLGPELRSEKIIFLTRNVQDRLKSEAVLDEINQSHFYSPQDLSVEQEIFLKSSSTAASVGPRIDEAMRKLIASRDPESYLMLNYDDLTYNSDIRHLPDEYSKMICAFLEVEPHVLTPATHKPRLIINEK